LFYVLEKNYSCCLHNVEKIDPSIYLPGLCSVGVAL
jgi:hypothetical protein